jgi:four helix bundle protein
MIFENLEVWKRSVSLRADIYREMRNISDYGFKDQITRAGLSVPSNIAEGQERYSHKEFCNFLNYAKGSCGELKTQIFIGMEINYIDKNLGKKWLCEIEAISSMIGGLIRSKRKLADSVK